MWADLLEIAKGVFAGDWSFYTLKRRLVRTFLELLLLSLAILSVFVGAIIVLVYLLPPIYLGFLLLVGGLLGLLTALLVMKFR
jgi:hypothetical protein